MVLPELLTDPNSALLIVALLLLLWLWLLINRRQESSASIPQRPIALSVEDLGRKVFICSRSNDLFTFRSLFINGNEARTLLGPLATAYLERRSPQALKKSLEELSGQIPNTAVFVGLAKTEGTELIIKIREGEEERDITIGSLTNIDNSWRLLQPNGGLDLS